MNEAELAAHLKAILIGVSEREQNIIFRFLREAFAVMSELEKTRP